MIGIFGCISYDTSRFTYMEIAGGILKKANELNGKKGKTKTSWWNDVITARKDTSLKGK